MEIGKILSIGLFEVEIETINGIKKIVEVPQEVLETLKIGDDVILNLRGVKDDS